LIDLKERYSTLKNGTECVVVFDKYHAQTPLGIILDAKFIDRKLFYMYIMFSWNYVATPPAHLYHHEHGVH